MKKIIPIFTCFVLALSLLWFGVARAIDIRSGASARVAEGEVVDSTLYASGQDVKVLGTVEGDVFCAAQNVEISGTVQGDVICAAQNITITGIVEGNVRVAGQFVSINGNVSGSATALGMSVDMGSGNVIGRDVTALGQAVTLDGTIGRDALTAGSSVVSSAKINRDLNATGDTIELTSVATVGGSFTYTSTPNATVASGAQIVGETQHLLPEETQSTETVISKTSYAMSVLYSFGSFLILGIVLLLVSPRLFGSTDSVLKQSPAAAFCSGLIGIVLLPILSVICFITFLGIPLGFLVLLLWVVSLMTGIVFSAQTLGSQIVNRLKWDIGAWVNFVEFVLGLSVLYLVGLVPYIGSLVMLFAVIWGTGALWYAVIKSRKATGSKKASAKDVTAPKDSNKIA